MRITRIKAQKSYDKTRIAVYCRVSKDLETQEDSLETQREAYTELVSLRSDWELVGVYADSLSGLSAEKRPKFMKMIDDALAGRIDRILCKSVSRFSRNVAECKKYTDLLRTRNVTVEFEKENLRTDDPTSSFIFSLMSAIAENESRSISENIQWGYRERYKRGEFNLGNNRILGYDTVDGKLVPNQDAWIIREIFERYVAGESYSGISRALAQKGAKSLRGGKFTVETIRYILSNETYVGDKHLMKQPPTDYLTHQPMKLGEYKDYYLTDDHEGIVSRELWDQAQGIKKGFKDNLKNGIMGAGEHHFLYGKVFCGECGAPFVRRTLKTKGGVYRKVWNCRERQKGKNGNGCRCRFISEEDLIEEIVKILGWEKMDGAKFSATVSRVLISNADVKIDF